MLVLLAPSWSTGLAHGVDQFTGIRSRLYASSLLDGSLSPDHLAEDWADWFHLAPAFVRAYGTDELEELGDATDILDAEEGQQGIALTKADRAYLVALEARLDLYPEIRPTKE